MSKFQLGITLMTALVVASLGWVESYGSSKKQVTIEAGMTLQNLVDNGLQIGMLVGHCGERGYPAYEVSAVAVSNTFDPISEIEEIITTFGDDGFGRTYDDLYIAFVGDPFMRLFELAKPIGGRSYDPTLRIGNVVESKAIKSAPFRIGRSLKQKYMKLSFVRNLALEENSEYRLGETNRGVAVISIYIPKYMNTNIEFWYKRRSDNIDHDASWSFSARKPKINYEQSVKQLYDDGLQVSLVLAPTDEAASWMPGEPFPVTAFAAGKDFYTTEKVLNHMDGISSFVPSVRFITIKGDLQGRLFQLTKNAGGEWVIDRVESKSVTKAPFELAGKLRQDDSKHVDFAYDDIKFVPWYTAEKGRTWGSYVGHKAVPVSYAKGKTYTSTEDLFKMPI